jgi:hypothetical protein
MAQYSDSIIKNPSMGRSPRPRSIPTNQDSYIPQAQAVPHQESEEDNPNSHETYCCYLLDCVPRVDIYVRHMDRWAAVGTWEPREGGQRLTQEGAQPMT